MEIYLASVPEENESVNEEEEEVYDETPINNPNDEDWEIISSNQNAQMNMSQPQQSLDQVCKYYQRWQQTW